MTKNQMIVLLIINLCSAALYRLFVAKGRMVLKYLRDYQAKRQSIFLVAGFLNQSDRAFRYIHFANDVNLTAFNFSLFGYNPKNAGKQIASSSGNNDVICAISVGAKAIEYALAETVARRIIFICPCSHPQALWPQYYTITRVFGPLLEVLSYALGWASFLPIIPIKMGGVASIALIADQLFWIAHGNPKSEGMERLNIVLSDWDELLQNDILRDIYASAIAEMTVADFHARTNLPEMAGEYESAIKFMLS